MRDFGRGSGRLGALDPAAKALYTLWLAFALAHFAFSFGMYWDRTMRNQAERPGGHLADVGAYYAGDEETLVFAKPFSRLMEITHQHLFAMPLTLLVAAHLFLMTRRSSREKTAIIALATVSMTGHLAAPWLVRYGGAGFAFSMPLTGIPFGATFAWMSIVPIRDMWAPAVRTPEGAGR